MVPHFVVVVVGNQIGGRGRGLNLDLGLCFNCRSCGGGRDVDLLCCGLDCVYKEECMRPCMHV